MTNRIYKAIIFFILIFFAFTYLKQINYGLPFFYNNDEGSFLKSTLYFFNFLSGNNKYLSDPFFAPLLNFIIVSIISVVYGIINLAYEKS